MDLFDPSLLSHIEEQRAYKRHADGDDRGVVWHRHHDGRRTALAPPAMEPGGHFGMTSFDFPEVRAIRGPAGAIPIRALRPERVDGVYLDFHGGG
jgi:hypothetical protein